MTVPRAAAPASADVDGIDGFGLRTLCTGVPRSVWLVTVLHLSLLLVWSLLVPVYRSPDEPYHVDLVRDTVGMRGWPAPDEGRVSRQVLASLVAAGYSAPHDPVQRLHAPLQIEDAPPRGQRRRFAELGAAEPSEERNQLVQHPPLYYLTVAVPVTVLTALVPAGWSYDQVVALMRLVSVLLVTPLPLLAFAATRRLTGAAGFSAVTASLVPLAIPPLTHIGSSVNNDNLLVLLVGVLSVALVHVATGDVSRRSAWWIGGLGAAALLTKGFALFLPLWVVLAYAAAAVRHGSWRPAGSAAVVALAVAGTLGGWWWLRNTVVYGTLQPSFIVPTPGPDAAPTAGGFVGVFIVQLVQRFWGSFGWDELHLAGGVVWTATALVVLGVALAFALPPTGVRGWRLALGVALLPMVAIAGIVVYGAWTWYEVTGRFAGIHGRYLFSAVVGLAAVVASGYGLTARRAARVLPLVLLAAAGLMQATAGYAVLHHFWGPGVIADPVIAVLALQAWAPWPPAVLLGVVGAVGAAGVAAFAQLLADARRG